MRDNNSQELSIPVFMHRSAGWFGAWCVVLLFVSGCYLLPDQHPATPHSIAIPSITPASTDAPPLQSDLPGGLQDMLPVMSGICFEAAYDAREQVFVLRSAEEHIRFYDLADNSGLCRRPVRRNPFDFSHGAVLAGLWSYGYGCDANHEIVQYQRDDDANTIFIQLAFFTEGDCNYELIRPFWVGIPDAQDYDIQIEVVGE